MQTDSKLQSRVVLLIGAVQFVNVLDFMMVMPLGPDFAKALGISISHLGFVSGSYAFSAAFAGLLGSIFLDRFDRRKALAVTMGGLALATILGAAAHSFSELLMSRLLAGVFGGPATSIALSIIADVIPPSRRGRAMGAVMGAFSVASVLGVPSGLWLARMGGWRLPFIGVGSLCLVVSTLAVLMLPSLTGHIAQAFERAKKEGWIPKLSFFTPEVKLAYTCVGVMNFAGFMMIPNFSAFLQFNLGYARSGLETLYMCGGVVAFFTMRLAGRLIDKANAFITAMFATCLIAFILTGGYIASPPILPVVVLFVGIMVGFSTRNVSVGSVSSRVPSPEQRARFMSFQSAVQHAASALGAFTGTRMLTEGEGHRLIGMPRVAALSLGLSLLIPFWLKFLEARVKMRESLTQTV